MCVCVCGGGGGGDDVLVYVIDTLNPMANSTMAGESTRSNEDHVYIQ